MKDIEQSVLWKAVSAEEKALFLALKKAASAVEGPAATTAEAQAAYIINNAMRAHAPKASWAWDVASVPNCVPAGAEAGRG